MELNEIYRTVCDVEGCSNIAFRQIVYEKNSKSGINICKNCLAKLYDCMAKEACLKGRKNEKR